MELFLLRHAQSSNNALVGGDEAARRVADPPLTEKGRRQAELLARSLADGGHLNGDERQDGRRRLDFLYCSAMLRALETATAVGESLGMAPHAWIDVHEVGGIWLEEEGEIRQLFGMSRRDVAGRFQDTVIDESFAEDGWWPGGLETGEERVRRAASVARALWARAEEDSRIGVVSHGGFMSELVAALIRPIGHQAGDEVAESGLYYEHDNTAMTRMHLKADKSLSIRYLNRCDHIPQELFS